MTTLIILIALTAYLSHRPTADLALCPAAPLGYRGTGRVKAATLSCCQRGSERLSAADLGTVYLGSYRASERG